MSNKIKQVREERNLSLNELSEKVGIPYQSLRNYEIEKREPKIEVWKKLADVLEVSPAYLMGLDNSNELKSFFPDDINDWKNIDKISNENLIQLSELITTLSNEKNGWSILQITELMNTISQILWNSNTDNSLDDTVNLLNLFTNLVIKLKGYDMNKSQQNSKEELNSYFEEKSKLINHLDKIFLSNLQ